MGKRIGSSVLFTLGIIMALALIIGCTSQPVATTPLTPAVTAPAPVITTPPPTPAVTTPGPAPAPSVTPTPATPPKPDNPTLIMASTTSTRDSGLMDVLIPIFQKQTGYVLKPVYVGTGAAITMGLQGNADVLLVHSPPTEVAFMQTGYGTNRKLVMHNDFVIVGPASDPAGIKGMTVAVDALKKIAAVKASFFSRGDASGTDVIDKTLWAAAGITVKDGAAANPGWYTEGGAGTGMLTLLQIADQKNGYTITDRATYLFNQKNLGLSILGQGDPGLLNIYHVIMVNQNMLPKVAINTAGAKALSDFLLDPATQALIAKYGVDQFGQPLFFPDADKTEASLGSQ